MTTRSQMTMVQQHVQSTSMKKTVFVRDLNNLLCCVLCNGYFREAHTIPECLHTFCKICLFTEFDKRSLKEAKYCPDATCNANVGLNPKVVFDRNLQAIVDKLFPQFAEQERLLDEQGVSNSSDSNMNGSSSSSSSSGTNTGGNRSMSGTAMDRTSSVDADGNQLTRPQLFRETGAQKRSFAHIEGSSGSSFIDQGSIKSSLYSHQLAQLSQHAQAAKRQSLGGTFGSSSGGGSGSSSSSNSNSRSSTTSNSSSSSSSSSRLLGSYRPPGLAPAPVESVEAQEIFLGLTLRVVPCDVNSSTTSTELLLPSLSKPLLRVTARSVGVDKIQRFIHKRMSAQMQTQPGDAEGAISTAGLLPEHIEILRDGTPMQATASISNSSVAAGKGADDVIILHYRRLLADTVSGSNTTLLTTTIDDVDPTAASTVDPTSLCE